MYYLVEKHGTFLASYTDWSQTWYVDERNAMKFWSKEHAASVAQGCEGTIQPRIMPN